MSTSADEARPSSDALFLDTGRNTIPAIATRIERAVSTAYATIDTAEKSEAVVAPAVGSAECGQCHEAVAVLCRRCANELR